MLSVQSSVSVSIHLSLSPKSGWVCKQQTLSLQTHTHTSCSGGIAVLVLNQSSMWRWVVSLTPRSLFLPGKSPLYTLDRRLGGSQSWSGRFGEEKIFFPLSEIRTPIVTLPTALSRYLGIFHWNYSRHSLLVLYLLPWEGGGGSFQPPTWAPLDRLNKSYLAAPNLLIYVFFRCPVRQLS
jgi:hypothetical protein